MVDVRCGGCLVWWMSYFMDSVVDVWCGGCLVWWMSFFAHGVVDVWCGGCLCGGCRTIQGSGLKDQDCKDVKDSDCIQHMVTIWSLGSRILTITKNQYQGSGLRIDIAKGPFIYYVIADSIPAFPD